MKSNLIWFLIRIVILLILFMIGMNINWVDNSTSAGMTQNMQIQLNIFLGYIIAIGMNFAYYLYRLSKENSL